MGVSTVPSYCGAQIFEAIGLSQELVDRYFTSTTSKLGGVGLDVIAEEVAMRHRVAYPPSGISPAHRRLAVGGTSGAAKGSPTCSIPTPCSDCSTRPKRRAPPSSASTPTGSTTSPSD